MLLLFQFLYFLGRLINLSITSGYRFYFSCTSSYIFDTFFYILTLIRHHLISFTVYIMLFMFFSLIFFCAYISVFHLLGVFSFNFPINLFVILFFCIFILGMYFISTHYHYLFLRIPFHMYLDEN